MDMARIIGTVVATRKTPSLDGVTLLVIQPVDERLQPKGEPLIASDSSGRRGTGEIVYYVASGDAVYTGPDGKDIPVDAGIIGIVDTAHLAGS
ncbi:MAG: EutN/CcmL family microcompartment protein [Candidatus Sumerlaeaceae bacterium]|nr:EutN/CcmL family microcompartment protein [Candidatus Sumerlaeaceae bacterium]